MAAAMPLVTFKNDECARMFNANMNYAMPSEGPRIFNINGQRYVKKGTEKVYGAGNSLTIWQKYVSEHSLEGGTKEFLFRQPAGLFTDELVFMMPYKEQDPLKFGYNVNRGHYADEFTCSSPDHEIKISDSGNLVVQEKASGQSVWVIYW